ncbi:hypothetical protein ACT17_26235 [Mycolicibacterium conceptionense]|jgi:uncharacterized protein YydD (DUF2326 family)|uniref:DUF2326 domain-containing protein n=2 Tax=Mycolicibacterium TaxID=1866885 RepID=A0ABR5FVN5_9MYCO|nr:MULTISPECIES: DUF2326 domain-containing protein [Mycolicibacterium]KLI05595.1 hypothetical protein AA982_23910 [Mycolicibacterium senegalense]KLO51949.1 hypothetical protein ABW05_10865 [Mycolicibacterium senegalense]KMV15266.1 hypothetical protein ACT17_26235 [Mycolicibacterium conceptionense]
MFISLTANRDEFQPINFKPGFNAIVAERAHDSSDQDSRNARGKSTLLKLMNYVLAGRLDGSLRPLAEDGWEMTLTLEMFGGTVAATRALAGGSKLAVVADDRASEVVAPWLSEGQIKVDHWKELLGLGLFRLDPAVREVAGGISVRTLLSYVIRTDTPKDPLKVLPQQSATSSREHIAFMMGLDWMVVHELAEISKGLEQLKVITAATRDGLVATLRPEEELVLERAALKNEVDEWEQRISGFRILEDPSSIVARADELTAHISRLRDEAVVDRRMRELFESSLLDSDNTAASDLSVETLFEAAGVILADGFRRQIDDVREFHTSLLANRRTFLRGEIESLDSRIEARAAELARLDEQRDNVLRTLDAGGALDELNSMRAELSESEARIAAVDVQIEQARELVSRRDELKLEQSARRIEASRELAGSREKLDKISDRFSQKMNRLYGKDAALTVSVDNDGFKFVISAAGSGSTGVNRMTLFCFDLTMLEEGIETAHHPDFLVHDSSVFDGVDPRQRAGALQFAQEMVATTGGQYICTINSNDVPDEVLDEDWFKAGIIRTVLDTETGGLVGREF